MPDRGRFQSPLAASFAILQAPWSGHAVLLRLRPPPADGLIGTASSIRQAHQAGISGARLAGDPRGSSRSPPVPLEWIAPSAVQRGSCPSRTVRRIHTDVEFTFSPRVGRSSPAMAAGRLPGPETPISRRNMGKTRSVPNSAWISRSGRRHPSYRILWTAASRLSD